MRKIKLAILFGGKSSEYDVSLHSASSVMQHLNPLYYEIFPIGITREGEWYYYSGSFEQIERDGWSRDKKNLQTVLMSSNPKDHGFYLLSEKSCRLLKMDYVFPILHGKNGEDGTVQGLLQLSGIPLVGCDALSSALCMDKDRAHKLVGASGIAIPRAVTFTLQEKEQGIKDIEKDLHYPLYVKPVRGGSSLGMSKVLTRSELEHAIDLAFMHDDEVTVEDEIKGFEVGCAVIGKEELLLGRVDEIELKGFFDYEEKYSMKTTEVHMPARIDEETEKRIQKAAVTIYKALGCSGFARVDMFLTPSGEIVFNEVNTIPGFTATSRFPTMMKGIGLSFSKMLDKIISNCSG